MWLNIYCRDSGSNIINKIYKIRKNENMFNITHTYMSVIEEEKFFVKPVVCDILLTWFYEHKGMMFFFIEKYVSGIENIICL